MQRLPILLELLLTNPKLSHYVVARHVGFSRRTVDRYSRLVAGQRWDQLRPLSAQQLDGMLNRQHRKCVKRRPDIASVASALERPGETLRTHWRSYRFEDPRTAVGYSRFATLYRAHVRANKAQANHADGDS